MGKRQQRRPPVGLLEAQFLRVYRTEALARQDGRCKYCRLKLTRNAATADHIVSQKVGGATSPENIAAACETCNHAKRHMSAEKFHRRIKQMRDGDHEGILLAGSVRRIVLAGDRAVERIKRLAAEIVGD